MEQEKVNVDETEVWNCGFCGAPALLEPNPVDGEDFFRIHNRGCACREVEYRNGETVYRRVRGHSLSPKKG